MVSDPDIHFGDLEEDQPEVERRPDRNRHYSVVAYGEPVEGELPMFVDLDALIEMESHALDDTSVELGGVMLGGQLTDEEGRPYVFIRDSIRAEHYEATKGSFKFTHDTWQEITRQRDEFPDDWDMVGWYHTHPDWGVFLSGMDMFICDNFFNKPLDVALVIDPCRQDRGLFQWTGNPRERVKRVGGFFVVASRHRQTELQQFIAELEEGMTVRTDPKLRGGYNISSGGPAPTIVNITEQQPRWLGQAIMLALVGQMMLILLVAYIAIAPNRVSDQREAEMANERAAIELQTQVLDKVISRIEPAEGGGSRIRATHEDLVKLENALAAATKGVPVLITTSEKLQEQLETVKKKRDDMESDRERYKAQYNDAVAAIERLEAKLAKYETAPGEQIAADDTILGWFRSWQGMAITVAVVVGALVIVAVSIRSARDELPPEEPFTPVPPPSGGHSAEQENAADFDDENRPGSS